MKADLATSIGVAGLGLLISYFACSALFSNDEQFSFDFSSIDTSTASTELADPNANLFNYKALNPTVEVYVGNCEQNGENGECLDEGSGQIEEDIIEEDAEDEIDTIESDTESDSTTGGQ